MTETERRDPGDLYERHGADLERFARSRTDASSAEDVVQETLRVALEKGVPADREGPWLFRVAKNKLRKLVDRARRRRETELPRTDLPTTALPTHAALDAREDRARVRRALAALAPEPREVVSLFYEEGLGHRAIAERLGIPATTVQSRLRVALRELHAHLIQRPTREEAES